MVLVNYHDTTFSPAGLWQCSNDLTDASGNGFTLTIGAGTERYGDIHPGVRGLCLDGSTYAKLSSFTSTLGITGDLTIELIGYLGVNTVNTIFVSHVGLTSGGTSVNNYLYSFSLGASSVQRLAWETGSRSPISYTVSDHIPLSGIFHWAVTRASGVVQFYVNGNASGAASGTLTSPTDGSSGTFKIGGDSTSESPPAIIASVKVIASALSATNIKSEYLKTLGGFYVA